MALPQLPLVQGFVWNWNSVDIKYDGISCYRATSIDWDDGMEHGNVQGQGPQKQGRTRGNYEATASLGMAMDYAVSTFEPYLLSKGQGGLYEVAFNLTVNLQAEANMPPFAIEIGGSIITKRTPSGFAKGTTDAIEMKYDLNVMSVVMNGIPPFIGFRQS